MRIKLNKNLAKDIPSRFIRLGSAARLTGHDANGNSSDGGEISGYTFKQSLGDPDPS